MAVTARLGAALALAVTLSVAPAVAQESDRPLLPVTPPAPFKLETPTGPADGAAPDNASDTWIFSGALQSSHESFSGTLVTGKAETQFELKLGGGATCAGGELKGDVGLVRLSEITCSDDRTMRALFVPQGGETLRVFGHVGKESFSSDAHLLGTEALPEKPQTTAPKAPIVVPPLPANRQQWPG